MTLTNADALRARSRYRTAPTERTTVVLSNFLVLAVTAGVIAAVAAAERLYFRLRRP